MRSKGASVEQPHQPEGVEHDDDLVGDDFGDRRLPEHVGRDVGEPVGVRESPPAPQ
jgi:hypothetical protein